MILCCNQLILCCKNYTQLVSSAFMYMYKQDQTSWLQQRIISSNNYEKVEVHNEVCITLWHPIPE